MEPEQQAENVIEDSRQVHGKNSYYHAQVKLPEDVKKLINKDVLLNNPDGPKKILEQEVSKTEQKTYEIKQYAFMNDGIWMKVIIEHDKNPALKDLTEENMKCTFDEESFLFEVVDPKTNDKYALNMPRTREKIVPEKSKYYVRKNKIYIALHKQKEEDWWTLKGV